MDILTLAGVDVAGTGRNHPFLDGNQRTGFTVGFLFPELNGYRFTASKEDAAEALLAPGGW